MVRCFSAALRRRGGRVVLLTTFAVGLSVAVVARRRT